MKKIATGRFSCTLRLWIFGHRWAKPAGGVICVIVLLALRKKQVQHRSEIFQRRESLRVAPDATKVSKRMGILFSSQLFFMADGVRALLRVEDPQSFGPRLCEAQQRNPV